MPSAVRMNADSAGGVLIQGSGDVFVDGMSEVRIGDKVKGHGMYKHAAPTMAEGSSDVFVNNIPASRAGDKATCGHPAVSTADVFING